MQDHFFTMIAPMLLMSNKGGGGNSSLYAILLLLASVVLKYAIDNGNVLKMIKSVFPSFVKTKSYILKARISFKHNIVYDSEITQEFQAIQQKLFSTITNDLGTKVDYTIDEHRIDGETMRFVCLDTRYEIAPDIMIKQYVDKDDAKHGEKDELYTYVTYTFEISCRNGPFLKVLEFIKTCTRDYDAVQVAELDHSICILDRFLDNADHPHYKKIPFTSNKTFDNMFFEGKEELLRSIDEFENGAEHYNRLGIPHTFGLFFHGRHGTGKTSCAKAIAAYTGRHVILASLTKIKTAEQFAALFMNEYVNSVRVPIKNRLYVFDDFDCSSWQSVVQARGCGSGSGCGSGGGSGNNNANANNSNNNNNANAHTSTSDIYKLAMVLKKDSKFKHTKHSQNAFDEENVNPITLGDVLEILDGFVEMSGRMAIFISNHPDNIDPAVMRCGRIDTKIEFKNMRRSDVAEMYKLWFGEDLALNKMRDYTWSQAEIGNIFKKRDLVAINAVLNKGSLMS